MEAQIERIACMGDDATPLTVIRTRFLQRVEVQGVVRWQRGAERTELSTGEGVRYIDATTFEIVGTGELLRRRD